MKNKKIFVLAAIILFLGVSIFGAVSAQDAPQGAPAQEEIKRPQVVYRAQDLRDPFKGQGGSQQGTEPTEKPVEKKPLPALTVQGIIWGGNLPQAIINNKVLKVGDTIEGVRVKSIGKDGITVLFEDSEYSLSSPATGPVPEKKPQGG